ncbi:MAG: DUF2141 domain-containing protein [Litorimonas sp.]
MNTKRFIALSGVLAAALALPIGGTAESSEFLAAQNLGSSATSKLIVDVKGLQSRQGTVMIGIYDTETGFETETGYKGQTAPVSAKTTHITFDGLPVSEYALKVFHDKDADGELNTHAF